MSRKRAVVREDLETRERSPTTDSVVSENQDVESVGAPFPYYGTMGKVSMIGGGGTIDDHHVTAENKTTMKVETSSSSPLLRPPPLWKISKDMCQISYPLTSLESVPLIRLPSFTKGIRLIDLHGTSIPFEVHQEHLSPCTDKKLGLDVDLDRLLPRYKTFDTSQNETDSASSNCLHCDKYTYVRPVTSIPKTSSSSTLSVTAPTSSTKSSSSSSSCSSSTKPSSSDASSLSEYSSTSASSLACPSTIHSPDTAAKIAVSSSSSSSSSESSHTLASHALTSTSSSNMIPKSSSSSLIVPETLKSSSVAIVSHDKVQYFLQFIHPHMKWESFAEFMNMSTEPSLPVPSTLTAVSEERKYRYTTTCDLQFTLFARIKCGYTAWPFLPSLAAQGMSMDIELVDISKRWKHRFVVPEEWTKCLSSSTLENTRTHHEVKSLKFPIGVYHLPKQPVYPSTGQVGVGNHRVPPRGMYNVFQCIFLQDLKLPKITSCTVQTRTGDNMVDSSVLVTQTKNMTIFKMERINDVKLSGVRIGGVGVGEYFNEGDGGGGGESVFNVTVCNKSDSDYTLIFPLDMTSDILYSPPQTYIFGHSIGGWILDCQAHRPTRLVVNRRAPHGTNTSEEDDGIRRRSSTRPVTTSRLYRGSRVIP